MQRQLAQGLELGDRSVGSVGKAFPPTHRQDPGIVPAPAWCVVKPLSITAVMQ